MTHRYGVGLGIGMSALLLGGCASSGPGSGGAPDSAGSSVASGTPSVAAPSTGPTEIDPTRAGPTNGGSVSPSPSACGSVPASGVPASGVPASSGPASTIATLRVSAPATAAPGASVDVRTTLTVRSDGPRIVVGPAIADLLVVQDGVVVGRPSGIRPQVLVPLALRAGTTREVQVVPPAVRMSGCGEGAAPLAPGSYELVAVLGYRQDALNSAVDGGQRSPGGTLFHLVSAPVVVTVA